MKLRKVLFRIFLAVFIVAVACIIGILVRDHKQNVKDQNLRDKAAVTSENDTEMSVDAEENTTIQIPVDFATLQEENPDIYAWIRIADTPIDYPILQSKIDDDYYMDHTVDDKEGLPGAIMTEYSYNPDAFESDAVTVVYGHNITDLLHYKYISIQRESYSQVFSSEKEMVEEDELFRLADLNVFPKS